jgi:hypothetical protein
MFFRFVPITYFSLIIIGIGLEKKTVEGVLVVTAISSVIFSLTHGSYDHIFFQGVDGLLFGIIGIKCGVIPKKRGVSFFRGGHNPTPWFLGHGYGSLYS